MFVARFHKIDIYAIFSATDPSLNFRQIAIYVRIIHSCTQYNPPHPIPVSPNPPPHHAQKTQIPGNRQRLDR